MKKKKIRISCAQITPVVGDISANIKIMKDYMDKTMEMYPDTDVILFPELALNGCEGNPDDNDKVAEPITGASILEMAAYAKLKNVFLVFGFIEKEEQTDLLYNSAVLIDREGEVLGQYRKMHLVEEEKPFVNRGNSDYPVFDTKIGKSV